MASRSLVDDAYALCEEVACACVGSILGGNHSNCVEDIVVQRLVVELAAELDAQLA